MQNPQGLYLVNAEAGSRTKMGGPTPLDALSLVKRTSIPHPSGANQTVFALKAAFLRVQQGARRPEVLGTCNACLCQDFSRGLQGYWTFPLHAAGNKLVAHVGNFTLTVCCIVYSFLHLQNGNFAVSASWGCCKVKDYSCGHRILQGCLHVVNTNM